jgi:hypothetical protein
MKGKLGTSLSDYQEKLTLKKYVNGNLFQDLMALGVARLTNPRLDSHPPP